MKWLTEKVVPHWASNIVERDERAGDPSWVGTSVCQNYLLKALSPLSSLCCTAVDFCLGHDAKFSKRILHQL